MIYFVGAGSGAADLITLRGAKLLEKADVVIWAGSLVNPELLDLCKKNCIILDSSRMTLQETTEALAKGESEGKLCVRLHTGDPSIYGAIREQMEELKARGIDYTVVPGVSSFCGAASALKCEYTVPEISQTVIISRMEGRTPVPDREKIRRLAEHGCSMVLFLSSGMIPALVDELKAGGVYADSTPCAVVYKATWKDEKIVRGTLGDIAQKALEAGINKTALVLVGNFLGSDYNKSKLYDAAFSTEFRTATESASAQGVSPAALEKSPKLCFERLFIISFTDKGSSLAARISAALSESCEKALAVQSLCKKDGAGVPLNEFVSEAFTGSSCKKTLVVFVGAMGIAVRSVAPFVTSKVTDPAVVCIDEGARFSIPLLSGHIGEANLAATVIAEKTGAAACITTATDSNGILAADSLAEQKGWYIQNPCAIKKVSSNMLKGEKPRLFVEPPLTLPMCFGDCAQDKKFLSQCEVVQSDNNADIMITVKERPCGMTGDGLPLVLVPRVLCAGVGCKKDSDSNLMAEFIEETLRSNSLSAHALGALASIDIKKDEKAICDCAARFGVPFKTFSAAELNSVDGDFSSSDFVKSSVGVDCVCERSAVAYGGGVLCVKKTARDGMTCAVALM